MQATPLCQPQTPAREIAADFGGRPVFGVHEDDPLAEAGAAERFARLHGDDVRYDHRRARWLVWQEHRWINDADAAVTRTRGASPAGR